MRIFDLPDRRFAVPYFNIEPARKYFFSSDWVSKDENGKIVIEPMEGKREKLWEIYTDPNTNPRFERRSFRDTVYIDIKQGRDIIAQLHLSDYSSWENVMRTALDLTEAIDKTAIPVLYKKIMNSNMKTPCSYI